MAGALEHGLCPRNRWGEAPEGGRSPPPGKGPAWRRRRGLCARSWPELSSTGFARAIGGGRLRKGGVAPLREKARLGDDDADFALGQLGHGARPSRRRARGQ